MTPLEYFEAQRDLLAGMSADDYQKVIPYIHAAIRLLEATREMHDYELGTTVNDVAQTLARVFPESMPPTFREVYAALEPGRTGVIPGALRAAWRLKEEP